VLIPFVINAFVGSSDESKTAQQMELREREVKQTKS
jgi:hypothetical protein